MDEDANTREDLRLPEGKLGQDIEKRFNNGEVFDVSISVMCLDLTCFQYQRFEALRQDDMNEFFYLLHLILAYSFEYVIVHELSRR